MVVSSTRTQSDERVEQTPLDEVISSLRAVLGDQIVTFIAGEADVDVIAQWATGATRPNPEAERRLRDGFRVVSFLRQQEAPDTIRAWIVGLNPDLDDLVPARVIADEPEEVMLAAGTFMAHG